MILLSSILFILLSSASTPLISSVFFLFLPRSSCTLRLRFFLLSIRHPVFLSSQSLLYSSLPVDRSFVHRLTLASFIVIRDLPFLSFFFILPSVPTPSSFLLLFSSSSFTDLLLFPGFLFFLRHLAYLIPIVSLFLHLVPSSFSSPSSSVSFFYPLFSPIFSYIHSYISLSSSVFSHLPLLYTR